MSQPDTLTQDVQHVSIDRVRAHPANPREGDVGAIWESIQENGFFGALVVQESSGCILAGNHRWMAAKEAGMQEVPVIYVDVDDERAMRILLADNRTNDIASYDGETLADLLEHLESTDEGLAGTGYDGDALDELLHDLGRMNGEPVEDAGADVDRAAELQEKWQTERGQLWQIGGHRLLCGDATDEGDVEWLLDGTKLNACFTSPPYNVGKNSGGGGVELYEEKYHGGGDDLRPDDYESFLEEAVALMLKAADEVFLNIQVAGGNKRPLCRLLAKWEGVIKDWVYWVKPSPPPHIEPGVMGSRVEWIIALSATNNSKKFQRATAARGQLWNVIEHSGAGGTNEYDDVHNATFPVGLAAEVLTRFTRSGDSVYDPFCGTGTTIMASENEARTCYAMELDPAYCAVILDRCTKAGLECTLVE